MNIRWTQMAVAFMLSLPLSFGQAKAEADVATILAENPDPFDDYDMAEILALCEGVCAVNLVRRPVPLVLGGSSLQSALSDIGGAGDIFSDPSGFGFTIGLSGDYLFEFDKADLTDKAQASLKRVAELYAEYEGYEVAVSGHTDAKGSDKYNQELSERRAKAVANGLAELGLNAAEISTQGFGEQQPIAPNMHSDGRDNPEGRARNRRVEITIKTRKKVNSIALDKDGQD